LKGVVPGEHSLLVGLLITAYLPSRLSSPNPCDFVVISYHFDTGQIAYAAHRDDRVGRFYVKPHPVEVDAGQPVL
jgi:hypothetical protein